MNSFYKIIESRKELNDVIYIDLNDSEGYLFGGMIKKYTFNDLYNKINFYISKLKTNGITRKSLSINLDSCFDDICLYIALIECDNKVLVNCKHSGFSETSKNEIFNDTIVLRDKEDNDNKNICIATSGSSFKKVIEFNEDDFIASSYDSSKLLSNKSKKIMTYTDFGSISFYIINIIEPLLYESTAYLRNYNNEDLLYENKETHFINDVIENKINNLVIPPSCFEKINYSYFYNGFGFVDNITFIGENVDIDYIRSLRRRLGKLDLKPNALSIAYGCTESKGAISYINEKDLNYICAGYDGLNIYVRDKNLQYYIFKNNEFIKIDKKPEIDFEYYTSCCKLNDKLRIKDNLIEFNNNSKWNKTEDIAVEINGRIYIIARKSDFINNKPISLIEKSINSILYNNIVIFPGEDKYNIAIILNNNKNELNTYSKLIEDVQKLKEILDKKYKGIFNEIFYIKDKDKVYSGSRKLIRTRLNEKVNENNNIKTLDKNISIFNIVNKILYNDYGIEDLIQIGFNTFYTKKQCNYKDDKFFNFIQLDSGYLVIANDILALNNMNNNDDNLSLLKSNNADKLNNTIHIIISKLKRLNNKFFDNGEEDFISEVNRIIERLENSKNKGYIDLNIKDIELLNLLIKLCELNIVKENKKEDKEYNLDDYYRNSIENFDKIKKGLISLNPNAISKCEYKVFKHKLNNEILYAYLNEYLKNPENIKKFKRLDKDKILNTVILFLDEKIFSDKFKKFNESESFDYLDYIIFNYFIEIYNATNEDTKINEKKYDLSDYFEYSNNMYTFMNDKIEYNILKNALIEIQKNNSISMTKDFDYINIIIDTLRKYINNDEILDYYINKIKNNEFSRDDYNILSGLVDMYYEKEEKQLRK